MPVALASNVPNWISWRLTQGISKNYHIVSSIRLLSLLEVHARKPRSSRSCYCFTIAQSEQRILLREAYSRLLEPTEVCITQVGVRYSIYDVVGYLAEIMLNQVKNCVFRKIYGTALLLLFFAFFSMFYYYF